MADPGDRPEQMLVTFLVDLALGNAVSLKTNADVFVVVSPAHPFDRGAACRCRRHPGNAERSGRTGAFREIETAFRVAFAEHGFHLGKGHAGFELIIVGSVHLGIATATGEGKAKEEERCNVPAMEWKAHS